MKTPDAKIREKLWDNHAGEIEGALGALLTLAPKKRKAAILDLLKIVYQQGLDRGYDLGYHVFGDGGE